MMKKSHCNYVNNYPTADFFIKHKDAVKVCVNILEDYIDIDEVDLDWICAEFRQKCFVNSDKWEIKNDGQ